METVTPNKLKILKPVDKILSIFYHTKKSKEKIDFDKIKSIIILDPCLIGDIIMSIPFLKGIRKNFKNAKITLVCAKYANTILKTTNLVDEFIIFKGNDAFLTPKNIVKYRKHLKETLKIINKNDYDIAIEPRGDIRYLFFMYYFNAKRKISYEYSGGTCFLTDIYKMKDNYKETHLIEDKMYLLECMGCKISKKDYFPKLKKDKKIERNFKKQNNLEKEILIGIHPGASKIIRQYPYYDKIIESINNKNVCYLIFKGYNEDLAVEKIENKLKSLKLKYLIINVSFEEYFKILGICDVLLCNDSGAGHIAAAYGIKTYVIFGPERPAGVRPYNNQNTEYINYECELKPCYKLKCPRNEQICFTGINILEISESINKYLKEINKR